MTPTRLRTLLLLALVTGVLAWGLAAVAYGSLATLPGYAPVTAGLIALFEGGLARTVSLRVRGRAPGRQLHPLQVARALVLAKASSTGGALLAGLYAGLFVWTFGQRDRLAAAASDSVVAGLSAVACLVLVIAALLLERSCRTPPVGPAERAGAL